MPLHSAESINILSSDFKYSAYKVYEELRQESPVHLIHLPVGRAWLITRYDDAVELLKDNERLSKNVSAFFSGEELQRTYLGAELANHMLNTDPPHHNRLRGLVQKAFTPRMIEGYRGVVQGITDNLLDTVEKKGSMELIEDLAYPLPILVICHILGVPEEDHGKFKEWSNAAVSTINDPMKKKRVQQQLDDFVTYLRELIKARRSSKGTDFISNLIAAEVEGAKLSAQELYSMIFLLMVAGHETTVNLIGNGLVALLTHTKALHKVREDSLLIPQAVEELLRFCGPVEFATNRWAKEDFVYRGKHIHKKDLILIVLASANRDESKFKNADTLDITRNPNKHIAFGIGTHFCLGASLARMEGQIALRSVLERFPSLRIGCSQEDLKYRPGLLMRGFVEVPLMFS